MNNDYEMISRRNALRQAHRWADDDVHEELRKSTKKTIVYFRNENGKRIQFAVIDDDFNPSNIDNWIEMY